MRLSRPDEHEPNKRRHFEISIDSPLTLLSCRATLANISLPAYSAGGATSGTTNEFECGCPGAALRRRNSPGTLASSTLSNPASGGDSNPSGYGSMPHSPAPPSRSWTNNSGGLARPDLAHLQDPNSGPIRPIHLMRSPSFNPPAFNDDDPPPPLVTPPPNYENIVSGNTNALADYFTRLADEMGDEDDRGDRGRVDHPLTPGGRVNRSMDASRDWLPIAGVAAVSSSSTEI